MSEQPLTLRDTARGIGVRAAVLGIGGLIVGGWLTAFAMKAAGKLVQIGVGLILLLVFGGVATSELKKVQRRLGGYSGA